MLLFLPYVQIHARCSCLSTNANAAITHAGVPHALDCMPLRRMLRHRHAQVGATPCCRAPQCCEYVTIGSRSSKPSRRTLQLHAQLHFAA
eukprot:3298721-Pleurochrysis_carterae.AAC.1